EFQKRKSSTTPKPGTSYRRKKIEKEDTIEDIELYHDRTTTLYYTNQCLDDAVTVLLVDGYNVCGYWVKLKKHFLNGRLDMVIVFDALISGLHTHKETFIGYSL
ncbi:hypothetical protein CFOL_v3_34992, partial [Cephalotus follicularis]